MKFKEYFYRDGDYRIRNLFAFTTKPLSKSPREIKIDPRMDYRDNIWLGFYWTVEEYIDNEWVTRWNFSTLQDAYDSLIGPYAMVHYDNSQKERLEVWAWDDVRQETLFRRYEHNGLPYQPPMRVAKEGIGDIGFAPTPRTIPFKLPQGGSSTAVWKIDLTPDGSWSDCSGTLSYGCTNEGVPQDEYVEGYSDPSEEV
jgi:hypothetical protein